MTKRYQAPQRFFTGDEVSIISGFRGERIRHQIVTKAGQMKVLLDNGTEWRQSGLKWGDDNQYRLGRAQLVDRKRGLQQEQAVNKHNRNNEIIQQFRILVDAVSKTNPADNIDECLARATSLLGYINYIKENNN